MYQELRKTWTNNCMVARLSKVSITRLISTWTELIVSVSHVFHLLLLFFGEQRVIAVNQVNRSIPGVLSFHSCDHIEYNWFVSQSEEVFRWYQFLLASAFTEPQDVHKHHRAPFVSQTFSRYRHTSTVHYYAWQPFPKSTTCNVSKQFRQSMIEHNVKKKTHWNDNQTCIDHKNQHYCKLMSTLHKCLSEKQFVESCNTYCILQCIWELFSDDMVLQELGWVGLGEEQ